MFGAKNRCNQLFLSLTLFVICFLVGTPMNYSHSMHPNASRLLCLNTWHASLIQELKKGYSK